MVLRRLAPVSVLFAGLSLSACAIGPDYRRPPVDVGATFKEADGWTLAAPSDALDKGQWWTVFNDPVLNDLEAQVEVSNQNLAAAEAAFSQAKALVEENQASFFPQVSGTADASRAKSRSVSTGGPSVSQVSNNYSLGGSATWDIDVWGRIRREVESARDQAKASEADIANAKLSAQISMANDYLALREQDEAKRLLDQSIAGYAKTLEITRNKFNAGVAAQSDVLTAQTTLQTAQAQAVDIVRTRAALEHAIAVLEGKPPSKVSIAALPTFNLVAPQVPVGVPSTLLERRPDVAAAERVMAAANAQIGVNLAGFFPDLSLNGADGVSNSVLSRLFNASSNTWSIGAGLTQTVFDAGLTQGKVRAAKAVYNEDVATYRQTVLTALQQVEDAIAAERVLQSEEQLRLQASKEADQAEQITTNQYSAGTIDYTALVVAQATALSARETAVQTTLARLQNAVNLISALGGGWQPTKDKMG
ncbi:MAG TPA: efflux transporter outer membrane subunit [Caulobacteraceae bacterium]|nr:efflux transporter outer membrane subunit [Caulobacteraceae bacterium]